VKRLLARLFFWVSRWRFEGALPADRRCVIIAAPHTSTWDIAFLVASMWLLGGRISWMAKHTLFRWPWGFLFRWLGGVAIDRTARHRVVEQMAGLFRERGELVLAVAAEGTRSYRSHWKSGFYHIARSAGVPIVCSYLDFAEKRVGIGLCFVPTDDVTRDMDRIRAFYADKTGRHPERFSPCRLREEGRLREEDGELAVSEPADGDARPVTASADRLRACSEIEDGEKRPEEALGEPDRHAGRSLGGPAAQPLSP